MSHVPMAARYAHNNQPCHVGYFYMPWIHYGVFVFRHRNPKSRRAIGHRASRAESKAAKRESEGGLQPSAGYFSIKVPETRHALLVLEKLQIRRTSTLRQQTVPVPVCQFP